MIRYEWAIELTENVERDVIDIDHADTYAEALARAATMPMRDGCTVEIALTRLVLDKHDQNLEDRQYAYVGWLDNGKLPPTFDGGAKVPVKFLREVNV